MMVRFYSRAAQKRLKEGARKMRENTTTAAEVRRVLKGGRPRILNNEPLMPLEAMQRIASEANKARTAMTQAGLDANDIKCGLIFCTPGELDKENAWQMKPLPAPEQQREFYTFFADFVKSEVAVVFLGILWHMIDREANPNGLQVSVWLTPFLGGAGTKAEKMLLAAKHHAEEVIKNGGKPLDN
ncbi:MAG TPA: hypothetical protein VF011_02775 [Terriglobales bacterium]